MPAEIVFANGGSVKVVATMQEVVDALRAGVELDTARFAGFRGAEAVGGERVLVNAALVAYAQEIAGP